MFLRLCEAILETSVLEEGPRMEWRGSRGQDLGWKKVSKLLGEGGPSLGEVPPPTPGREWGSWARMSEFKEGV